MSRRNGRPTFVQADTHRARRGWLHGWGPAARILAAILAALLGVVAGIVAYLVLGVL